MPETLILFNIEADAQTSFQSTFTPADFLGVRIDIAIDGGLAGMASLTRVTNTFQAVPEPAAWLFMLIGLASFFLARRRMKRAATKL